MVASLQSKKEALEAKLRDKTQELKRLCFEEAELTGILPAETPLDPGESPPPFRRRVGTSFAYPENLIDKLQSKEDKAVAALELDCKIQTGIAEAALGIANDGSTSKSVRRKHKVIYQESQRRLFELEAQLNSLKLIQARQVKKNGNTTSDGEFDCVDGDARDQNSNSRKRHTVLSHSLSDQGGVPVMRHYHTFGSLPRHDGFVYPQNYRTMQHYPRSPGSYYLGTNLNPVWNQKYIMGHNHQQFVRSPCQTPTEIAWQVSKSRDVYNSDIPNNNCIIDNTPQEQPQSCMNRPVSVEPPMLWMSFTGKENRMSSTLPRNVCPPTNSILLPGQTYPDNSLMRTQSLGNVGSYQILPDKKKEKEWYETSLDSTPLQMKSQKPEISELAELHVVEKVPEKRMASPSTPLPPPLVAAPPPPATAVQATVSEDDVSDNLKTHHALINNLQFDTVVPYESPKNHTVIEAGKWQPYREVTKPFEMSDFYKYSTKFRKGKTSPSPSFNSHSSDKPSLQQKVVYKPLKPQECQALSNKPPLSDEGFKPVYTPNLSMDAHSPVPPKPLSWFNEEKPSNPASATIV